MTSPSNLPDNKNAQKIYAYLVAQKARGARLPPTREEIAHGAEIASTGTVDRWLKRLALSGLVVLYPGQARAVFVREPTETDGSSNGNGTSGNGSKGA